MSKVSPISFAIPSKIIAALAMLFVAIGSASSFAVPVQVDENDLVEIELFQVDDNATVTLSNASNVNIPIATKGFSNNLEIFNISSQLIVGNNNLRIQLQNTSRGWTLGWNLLVNNVVDQSFSCGTFNTFGCNNNSFQQGIVYDQTIPISVSGIPVPASFALLGSSVILLPFWLGLSRRFGRLLHDGPA